MTKRIMNAIDVFLDAINNGTLAKASCTACAVGNLVAHGKGLTLIKLTGGEIKSFDANGDEGSCNMWMHAFYTCDGEQVIYSSMFDFKPVEECIEATEFTIDELMKIEYAFETNTKISFQSYHHWSAEEIRKDQIKGLAAVVKVMLTFDEQPSTDEVVNELFTSKAELIPLN